MERHHTMNIPVFSMPRVYFGDTAMEALRAYNHKTGAIVTDGFMAKSDKTDYLAGFMPHATGAQLVLCHMPQARN
ncbi:MAG: hypothetical protein ACR5LF_11105 [Symbiopectobacterium sp.]